jgi:hypothetical protein
MDSIALGGVFVAHGILRSTDHGSTWSIVASGLPASYVSVNGGFAIVDTVVFAGLSNGVYRSLDKGLTWAPAGSPLGNTRINGMFASNGMLFAGTDSAAFISLDLGQSWKLLCGWPLVSFAAGDGYIYATDAGHTIYRRQTGTLLSAREVAPVAPADFVLEQNFPNPFNPSTTIRYGLPDRSHVILTVYNTLSQQVVELRNDEEAAGYHEVQFHSGNLASGVYFYRLDVRTSDHALSQGSRGGAESVVQTKKFILVK